MEMMQASRQWMSRPSDERFTSLIDMRDHFRTIRQRSAAKVLPNRDIMAAPVEGAHDGLVILGPNGAPVTPTNWAFGQLAQRAGAPAGYLRNLPAPIAADCINWGLKTRDVEELGILLQRGEGGANSLAAVTGPNYGRIWNESILNPLVERFGDGVTGAWKVPGEFGVDVEVTKANTTLFASDRDFFVFLADEKNRVEVPNRRDGKSGEMARGFFVSNSEVGAATFTVQAFLFDYVCCNRIVWGAQQVRRVAIRHTSGAPHRWIEEARPMIEAIAAAPLGEIVQKIQSAKKTPLGNAEKVAEFLANRFSKSEVQSIKAAHAADEGRPIETLWDATTGVTAYARSIPYQNERVIIEAKGGAILDLAA